MQRQRSRRPEQDHSVSGGSRSDPGATRSGDPPGEGQARTPRRRTLAGVELGHHETAWAVKGVWFHLYVLIDIYSRYNPGWIVSPREDSELARDFLSEAIRVHLDEVQTRVRIACRSWRHSVSLAPPCLE